MGRFTTADGAVGGADPFDATRPEIVVGQGDGNGDAAEGGGGNGDAQLHLVTDGPGSIDRVIDVEEEDEKYGGHAFKRHVARPDEELLGIVSRDRYSFPGIAVARKAQGSFLSREDANNLVNRTLEENAADVRDVAVGKLATASFSKRFGYVTGKEAFRPHVDAEPLMRPTYEVFVIIDHDRRSPRAFRVFTAYPKNQYPNQ